MCRRIGVASFSGSSHGIPVKLAATAVEFAIVSLPYFATVFFIMENGYNFFVQSQLEHATALASRSIMLG